MSRRIITTPDVRRTAVTCRAALTAGIDRDWTRPAGDLEWSCQATLAHMLSAVLAYAVNLASRSTEPRPSGQANVSLDVAQLLDALEGRANVLAVVCKAAPADARGAHQYGVSDPEGFIAMACDEMLIHTYDIAGGLGAPFEPDPDLCRRVLARLFPWAPTTEEPWRTLLWANGRATLDDRPRLNPDWRWHSAPLDEWDGADPNAART